MSLLLIFGQVEAEIIVVKDTRGHSQVFASFSSIISYNHSSGLSKLNYDLKLHKSVKTENDH